MRETIQEYAFDITIILLLILANSILAMSELAIVSSNRKRMEILAKRHRGAKAALDLMTNPGPFLSTIQIGITIIGIISGAFSGHKFAEPLGAWLNAIPWIRGNGNILAFSIVVILITYVSIVLGELIPKHIALSKPEAAAILLAKPIQFLSKITHPFVQILDLSTKSLLKVLRLRKITTSVLTEEEIQSVVEQGLAEGTIDALEHRIFRKALQFGDLEASMIMTPRINVVSLDLAASPAENEEKVLSNPHRYYPVVEDGIDNLRGIFDTKDALAQLMRGKPFDLRNLTKDAPCVLENNSGPDLLEHFKKYKTHIAIVVDEYGAMQGVITVADLLKTLVGAIPESHQGKHYEITTRTDGSWLCDGLTPINEIEDLLKTKIVGTVEDSNFDTLAGFLLVHFKHIPRVGEYLYWENFKFEIVDMDSTRIDKVLIQKQIRAPYPDIDKS